VKIVTFYCVLRENCHSELFRESRCSELCVSWKLVQFIVCFVKIVTVNLCFVKIVTVNCVFSEKLSQFIGCFVKIVTVNCFVKIVAVNCVFFRENRRSELCVLVKTVAVKYVFVRIVAVNCVFRENCSSEMCISWKSWHWKPCLNSGRKFISLLYHVHRRTWLKFRTSDVHVMLFRIGDFRENRPRECFYLVLV